MDIPGLAAHLHAMEQQHLATALQVSASALDSRLPRLPWSGVYHAVAMSGASKMLALRAGEQRRTLHPCSRGVAEFFKFSLFSIQRDPKGIAKKNGAQLEHRVDIFSQLAPILRSAGTSEVRLVLNAVWTRARPMRGTQCAGPRAVREPGAPRAVCVRRARFHM